MVETSGDERGMEANETSLRNPILNRSISAECEFISTISSETNLHQRLYNYSDDFTTTAELITVELWSLEYELSPVIMIEWSSRVTYCANQWLIFISANGVN